jgi:hypothetical protein
MALSFKDLIAFLVKLAATKAAGTAGNGTVKDYLNALMREIREHKTAGAGVTDQSAVGDIPSAESKIAAEEYSPREAEEVAVAEEKGPCEICSVLFPIGELVNHEEVCKKSNASRPVLETAPCEICNKSFPLESLLVHQESCKAGDASTQRLSSAEPSASFGSRCPVTVDFSGFRLSASLPNSSLGKISQLIFILFYIFYPKFMRIASQ